MAESTAGDSRGNTSAPNKDLDDVPLVVHIEQQGDALRVEACGEIDLFTTPIFRKALEEACTKARQEAEQKGIQNILVDLRQVRFLDSAGLASLVDLRRDLQPACTITLVIAPKTQPERVLLLSRFDTFFPILDSVPAFAPPQA